MWSVSCVQVITKEMNVLAIATMYIIRVMQYILPVLFFGVVVVLSS